MPAPFENRRAAGRVLAAILQRELGDRLADVVVLALPRGGVPVGYEVATTLGVPLDIFVVRKLGVPGHEELAMGAIASGGVRVLNNEVVEALEIDPAAVEDVAGREELELRRREDAYRDGRDPVALERRVAVLVDDGLATGASMRAAALAVRARHPREVVIAVPVAAGETCRELESVADRVLCADTPDPFRAVGLWYRDFRPTSDDEVRRLLGAATPPGDAGASEDERA